MIRSLLLCLTAVASSIHAQQKDPQAFSIQTYSFFSPQLSQGFATKDKGTLTVPALPGKEADEKELRAWLQKGNSVLREFFWESGLPWEQGNLAAFDKASSTLVVKCPNSTHAMIQGIQSELSRVPQMLQWRMHIMEMPSPQGHDLVMNARAKADHAAELEALLAAAPPVVSLSGETKSGQRATGNSGPALEYGTAYSADKKGRVSAVKDQTPPRTRLELDPTASPDKRIIHVNLALQHRYADGSRWEPMLSGQADRISALLADHELMELATSMQMLTGQTRLLTVWPVKRGEQSMTQAAFFQIALAAVQPPQEDRVRQLVERFAKELAPEPKAGADPDLPPGMEVRRYRVPADLLSCLPEPETAAAPADPFAPGGSAAGERKFMRAITAEEILRAQGIPFPQGASASYFDQSLVVRNTAENLEMVEALISSMLPRVPKNLTITTRIIQGSGSTLRAMQKAALGQADHTAIVTKTLADASVRLLRSDIITTRSGNRCSVKSGRDLNYITESSFGERPALPAAPASARDDTEVTAVETRRIGYDLEIDPVIGPDGHTLELNLIASFDTAPPTQSLEPALAGETKLATPLWQWHDAETQTSFTLLSASTRILSVWKPSGSDEHEGDILQALLVTADVVPVE
jgi:hypothetical protein